MANTYQLLTGPQPAGVAVFSLRGGELGGFFQNHLNRQPKVGRLTHTDLLSDEREVIDDVLIALFSESHAELSSHGGPEIVRQVSALLSRSGFQIYSPDPTSIQDRIRHALPFARTKLATQALLAQARLQHLPPNPGQALRHLLHPPTIAIIGPPNVGKSTLSNALSRSNASITADLPGTTRDYVLAEGDLAPDLGGFLVRLLDSPGHRETADPIEAQALVQSELPIREAAVRLLVLDAPGPLTEEARRLLRKYPDAVLLANRADLGVSPLLPPDVIPVSAQTGRGLSELQKLLSRRLGVMPGIDDVHWRDW